MSLKTTLLTLVIALQGGFVSAGVLLPSSSVGQTSVAAASDDAQSEEWNRTLCSRLLGSESTGFAAPSTNSVFPASFAAWDHVALNDDLQRTGKISILDWSLPPPPELLGLIKPPIG